MSDPITINPFTDGLTYTTRIHGGNIISVGTNNPFVMIAPMEGEETVVLTWDELLPLIAAHHAKEKEFQARLGAVLATAAPTAPQTPPKEKKKRR